MSCLPTFVATWMVALLACPQDPPRQAAKANDAAQAKQQEARRRFEKEGIELDAKAQTAAIRAIANRPQDPIEYLLVHRCGKQDQAMFCTDTTPSVLEAALRDLGLPPGKNATTEAVAPTPAGAGAATIRPPQGSPFWMTVKWKSPAGRAIECCVEDLLFDVGNKRPLTDASWIHLGGSMVPAHANEPDVFAADLEGNLISVCYVHPDHHLATLSHDGAREPRNWRRTDCVPDPGTEVQLVFHAQRPKLQVERAERAKEALAAAEEQKLVALLEQLTSVDWTDEASLVMAKDRARRERGIWRGTRVEADVMAQITRINAALATIERTRGLVLCLDGIEAKLADHPTLDVLGQQFEVMRDAELVSTAEELGGNFRGRFRALRRLVTRNYVDNLRTAATNAALATTGVGLAPFGQLEDTLRLVVEAASAETDIETQATYRPMYIRVVGEITQIVNRLFDDAYIDRVPWKDLLADPAGWLVAESPSFTHKFGDGLLLTNAAGPEAVSGGLTYTKAGDWRDYVMEIEVKLDRGTLVLYTRIDDSNKLDSKMVPAFSFGTKNANVIAEYGKRVVLLVRVIGWQINVSVDGSPVYQDDISMSKSRKGKPGLVVQAGSTATITRMRVRHLR